MTPKVLSWRSREVHQRFTKLEDGHPGNRTLEVHKAPEAS